jgi:hypothetical protein
MLIGEEPYQSEESHVVESAHAALWELLVGPQLRSPAEIHLDAAHSHSVNRKVAKMLL